ncbi:hypothetical protein ACFQ2M_24930 [Kitasatospora saccharophila]|uniref:hypothetical protein n=1 Tax=Kitasatospora saccharophila TaxID=407973 RepID=UPI00364070F3
MEELVPGAVARQDDLLPVGPVRGDAQGVRAAEQFDGLQLRGGAADLRAGAAGQPPERPGAARGVGEGGGQAEVGADPDGAGEGVGVRREGLGDEVLGADRGQVGRLVAGERGHQADAGGDGGGHGHRHAHPDGGAPLRGPGARRGRLGRCDADRRRVLCCGGVVVHDRPLIECLCAVTVH